MAITSTIAGDESVTVIADVATPDAGAPSTVKPSRDVTPVIPAGKSTPDASVSWILVTFVPIARAHVSQRKPP